MRCAVHGIFVIASASSCDRAADDETPAATPPASEAAPASPEVAPAPRVENEPAPRGFAIVRGGAEVFANADGKTPIGKLPAVHPASPSDPALVPAPASGMVVAVVGARDELVAIETFVDGSKHCARDLGTWANLRVGLFVRASDLMPVTTRAVEHAFADGTRVLLGAGVPVGDAVSGADARVVDGGDLGLELPLPADAVGRYYEPAGMPDPLALEIGYVALPELSYGGGRPLGPPSALRNGGSGVDVYERAPLDDARALVRVSTRCASVWAVMDAKADVAPNPASGGVPGGTVATAGILGMLGSPSLEGQRWRIDPGVALTWPDGRPAGLVERTVTTKHAPRVDGTRSCVVVPFEVTEDGGPELCVETSALHEETSPDDDVWAVLGTSEGAPGIGDLGAAIEGTTGEGFGFGRSAPGSSSRSKLGKAKVSGSLDKEVIRRVVRRHLASIKYCYETELVKDAALAGRIEVSFVIAADGAVSSAEVKSSTMGNDAVERCVVKKVESMVFPKPTGGGVVAVSYPFVFTT